MTRWLAAFATLFALLVGPAAAQSRPLPEIRVAANGHMLETADGKPFFWLGDTAWELIHSTTRDEASFYLRTRARQGYNLIQTVVLAEMDGLTKPTPDGLIPFQELDPSKPNAAYFDRVAELVDEAAANGLYVGLLPTWGDKLTAPWGAGPRIFTVDNVPLAQAYARYLGTRLRGRTNIVWILGGDRPAHLRGSPQWQKDYLGRAGFSEDVDFTPIWRAMAAGLAEGLRAKPLILFHPAGGIYSSSLQLPNEPWLSINAMQSGHGDGHDLPVWDWIARDYAARPAKPTIDIEPNYEDHPVSPWPRWNPAMGYFRDHDVRKQTYRAVLAGAAGTTYGHHAIWGFVGARNDVINHGDRDWIDALHRPAGRQMRFLKDLALSRPYLSRVPDDSIVTEGLGEKGSRIVAARGAARDYAFVYFPDSDLTATIDLGRALASPTVRVWWYDTRTGAALDAGAVDGQRARAFTSPSYGPDWVLVLDDPAKRFPQPGFPLNRD